MARTGFWFQTARGRAIVRNQCMRHARRLKAKLPHALGDLERLFLTLEIQSEVRRAREAHRDWRKYRQLHLEFERD
jgi:hypothetical protein